MPDANHDSFSASVDTPEPTVDETAPPPSTLPTPTGEATTDAPASPSTALAYPSQPLPPEPKADPTPQAPKPDPFADFYSEFAEKGAVGDESYQKLADMGIPREAVDLYVAGHEARVAAAQNEIKAAAGGEDGWNALNEWSKTLPPAELAAINEVLTAGGPAAKFAVEALTARMKSTTGTEPTRTVTGNTPGAGDTFSNRDEMVAAMRDPKYQKGDPEYHRLFDAKFDRSIAAGADLG